MRQKELTTLADQINGVLARRNAFFASAGPLAPEDLAAAERGFVDQAVGLVRGCAGRIQADLDAYDRVLASRTGFLADLGYEPPIAEAGPPVDRKATTTLAPGLIGSEVLRTPPGARLEGGLDPGVTITVPAPGGGLVLGTPPAPDLGTGQTDRGLFPFPVPDGSRVLNTGGADQPGRPAERPVVHEGKQGKHVPGHPNFDPERSDPTGDAGSLIGHAGTGEQVGAIPVGQPGSREGVDFGEQIGLHVDQDTKVATPTTVGLIHYGKTGAHIVPARPR